MGHYVLSKKAQTDIEAIYDYGSQKFSKQQALNYLIGLREQFQIIVNYPQIGKERTEIKSGLYSFPYISHIIFYRICKNHIRIVRVLHGSRDIIRFLKIY